MFSFDLERLVKDGVVTAIWCKQGSDAGGYNETFEKVELGDIDYSPLTWEKCDASKDLLFGVVRHYLYQQLIKRYGKLLFWLEQVPVYCSLSEGQEILQEASGLVELRRVTTYYDSDYSPAVLRPTIADAIIQCPKDILDQVVAFEFVAPSRDTKDYYDKVLGMHVLTTVYYAGVVPQEIAAQKVSLY